MVKYEDSLKKPFTDWKKLIIGILLNIIPIVNFTMITGYQMECSGLGKNKSSKKMPEWKKLKYFFMKGLVAFGIKIVYMLPAIILVGIGILIVAVNIIQIISSAITPQILHQITTDQAAIQRFWQTIWINNGFSIITTILKISPVFIAGGILYLLAKFVLPIAILNYLKKGRFSAAFEFGLVFKKAFTTKYILAVLVLLVTLIVFGATLSLIPFIGPIATSFIIGVMGYGLLGQVYRETK